MSEYCHFLGNQTKPFFIFNPGVKTASNDYIAGKGSVLKVYMFIMWLNRFAKLVNVNSFFAVFF